METSTVNNNVSEILTKDSKGQIKAIGDKLKVLHSKITPKDKAAFLELNKEDQDLKMSLPTLNKYLNGNGVDLETSIGMYLWFAAKVKFRERALEEALA